MTAVFNHVQWLITLPPQVIQQYLCAASRTTCQRAAIRVQADRRERHPCDNAVYLLFLRHIVEINGAVLAHRDHQQMAEGREAQIAHALRVIPEFIGHLFGCDVVETYLAVVLPRGHHVVDERRELELVDTALAPQTLKLHYLI